MSITDELILSVNALTEDELIRLNQIVVHNIKVERTRKMDRIRNLLSVGDVVTFTGRERGRRGHRFPVTGKISKIKRKRAEVKCFDKGLTWDVNMSCLTRIEIVTEKESQ